MLLFSKPLTGERPCANLSDQSTVPVSCTRSAQHNCDDGGAQLACSVKCGTFLSKHCPQIPPHRSQMSRALLGRTSSAAGQRHARPCAACSTATANTCAHETHKGDHPRVSGRATQPCCPGLAPRACGGQQAGAMRSPRTPACCCATPARAAHGFLPLRLGGRNSPRRCNGQENPTGSAHAVQSSAPAACCWNVDVAWLARSMGMNAQYSGMMALRQDSTCNWNSYIGNSA